MTKAPVHVGITFNSRANGTPRPLLSHPLTSLAWTVESNQLMTDVGFYHRTSVKGDLPITLTVTRLRPDIKRVWLRASSTGSKGVFGGIRETRVTFQNDTETVTVKLRQNLARAVVAKLSVTWNWFFRTEPTGPWTRLRQLSRSDIYTTVGRPQPPWGARRSERIEIPWSEALSYACRWAHGARDAEQLCDRLTIDVLKNQLLRYSPGASAYVDPGNGNGRPSTFDCASFLGLLRTKNGSNRLDCSGVASIICTFANLLGADLYENELQLKPIPTTDIKTTKVQAIGSKKRRPYHFPWHEIAWKPPGEVPPRIWDGCFRFLQSRRQRLATGLSYNNYWRLLIGKAERQSSYQQTRLRRPVVKHGAQLEVGSKTAIASMKLRGWTYAGAQFERLSPELSLLTSMWVSTQHPHRRRLSIQIYDCHDEAHATKMLLFLTAHSSAKLVRLDDFGPNEEAFATDESGGETLIYFRVGRQVIRVMSVGLTSTPIRPEATVVDRWVRSSKSRDPLMRLLPSDPPASR